MKPTPLLAALFVALGAAYCLGHWAAVDARSRVRAEFTPTKLPIDRAGHAGAPIDPVADANINDNAAQQIAVLKVLDLNGMPQTLSQWAGKIRVINYWATWCRPCREEMPVFSLLHERYAARGVQFVGLSIDSGEQVRDYQKVTAVSYPLLIALPEALELTTGLGNAVQGLPFTLVLDRQGNVAATRLGRYSESELESLIRTLL